jgi:hypothetical protein
MCSILIKLLSSNKWFGISVNLGMTRGKCNPARWAWPEMNLQGELDQRWICKVSLTRDEFARWAWLEVNMQGGLDQRWIHRVIKITLTFQYMVVHAYPGCWVGYCWAVRIHMTRPFLHGLYAHIIIACKDGPNLSYNMVRFRLPLHEYLVLSCLDKWIWLYHLC